MPLASLPAGLQRRPGPGPLGGPLDLAGRGRGRGPARRSWRGLGADRGAGAAGRLRRSFGSLVSNAVSTAGPQRARDAPSRGRLPGHQRLAQRPPARLPLRLLRPLRVRCHLPAARPEPPGHLLRVADRDRPLAEAPRDGRVQRRRQPALSELGVVQPAGGVPVGGPRRAMAPRGAGIPGAGGTGLGAAPAPPGSGRCRQAGGRGADAQPGRPRDGRRGAGGGHRPGHGTAPPQAPVPGGGRSRANGLDDAQRDGRSPLVALADRGAHPVPLYDHGHRGGQGVLEGRGHFRLSGRPGACRPRRLERDRQRAADLLAGCQLHARHPARPAQRGDLRQRPEAGPGGQPGCPARPRARAAGGVLPPR